MTSKNKYPELEPNSMEIGKRFADDIIVEEDGDEIFATTDVCIKFDCYGTPLEAFAKETPSALALGVCQKIVKGLKSHRKKRRSGRC